MINDYVVASGLAVLMPKQRFALNSIPEPEFDNDKNTNEEEAIDDFSPLLDKDGLAVVHLPALKH